MIALLFKYGEGMEEGRVRRVAFWIKRTTLSKHDSRPDACFILFVENAKFCK